MLSQGCAGRPTIRDGRGSRPGPAAKALVSRDRLAGTGRLRDLLGRLWDRPGRDKGTACRRRPNTDPQSPGRREIIAHLGALDFVEARDNVVFPRTPGNRQDPPRDRSVRAGLPGRPPRCLCHGGQWVARLAEAHSLGRLQAEFVRLGRYPLLVIDEVGYIPFEAEAANLFFQLVSSRYERASICSWVMLVSPMQPATSPMSDSTPAVSPEANRRTGHGTGRISPVAGAFAAVLAAWASAAIWAAFGPPVGIVTSGAVLVCLIATRAVLPPLSILLALIPASAIPMTGLVSVTTQYVPTAIVGAALLARFGLDFRSSGLTGLTPRLPPRIVLAAVGGFVAWSLLSTATSAWPTTGVIYVAGMVATLTICFVVAPAIAAHLPSTRRSVLETIVLCGVVAAAFDLVLMLTGPITPFDRSIGRYLMIEVTIAGARTGVVLPWATGPFLEPASASAILVAALLALVALHRTTSARSSRLLAGGTVVVVGALLLTWTRTGWFAVCVGLGFIALDGLRSHRPARRAIGVLAVFAILSGGLMVGLIGADLRADLDLQRYGSADTVRGLPAPSPTPASPAPNASPGTTATTTAGGSTTAPDQLLQVRGGSSLSGRLTLWVASVNAVRARPITGWGPGTNPQAIAPFLGTSGADYTGLSSHSTWLRTAVETGVPGLVLIAVYVLGVLVIAARAYAKHRAPPDTMSVGLIAVFVALVAWQTFESSILGGLTFPAFLWALTGGLATSAVAPRDAAGVAIRQPLVEA